MLFFADFTHVRRQGRPVEINADDRTGLRATSYAQCELLRSLNRWRLIYRIGTDYRPLSDHVTLITKTLLSH